MTVVRSAYKETKDYFDKEFHPQWECYSSDNLPMDFDFPNDQNEAATDLEVTRMRPKIIVDLKSLCKNCGF